MTKKVFIFKGDKSDRDGFCDIIKDRVISGIMELNPSKLKLTITEDKPPAISIIPFSKTPVACISVEKNLSDDTSIDEMAKMEEFAKKQKGFVGIYLVSEAVPVAYEMNWPVNTRTPGACMLTLFCQKKGISHDEFLNRWFNGHTPLSLKLHPLWNYVRNQVTDSTGAAAHYDGIVEEHVKDAKDLLRPFRFFGPFYRVPLSMLQTLIDVTGFIQYSSIETYLVSEYWYQS